MEYNMDGLFDDFEEDEDEFQFLIEAAEEARMNAYAPYSNFTVGAAVMTMDGFVYLGSNIENASYGLSNCAERTAIFKAVSEGNRKFKAIAITGGPADQPGHVTCPPCGACRQVMREFCDDDCVVIYSAQGKSYTQTTLGELLPESFGGEQVKA